MQLAQRLLRIVMPSALLFNPLLTACGTTNPQVPETKIVTREHYSVPTPDASLRVCKPRPTKPVLKTDADEANLIVDLDERGEDCASKLASIWKSIDDAISYVDQRNKDAQK